jgi:alkylation response protein AidB-like acyl-CoA dehydrogenase
VNLDLSDDQLALRAAFATLLSKESSPERVRAAEPLGFDAALWRHLVRVGVPAMGTAEGGGSLVDLAVVCEQAGSHVAPAPVVESLVATRLLDRFGVACGDQPSTLALRPAVDGVWMLVPGGAVARDVVGLVGDELVLVHGDPRAQSRSNLGGTPLADRAVSGDAVVLARGAGARAAFEHACDEWRVLTAATLVGIGQGALDLGVEYAKSRRQFDAPIGSFQAVQQRLADVATALTGARLLVLEAAWALAARPERFAVLAAMAFAFAGKVAGDTTAASLRVHGGYGFMLEYDVQLYYRRAKADFLAAGDPADTVALVGDRLYEDAPRPAPAPSGPEESLDFSLGAQPEAFRAEARAFFDAAVTPEVLERVLETGTIHDWGLHRALADRGWLAASWPRELGGQERDPFEMVAFDEEVARAGAPMDGWGTTELVARTLLLAGNDEQRRDVIPRALRGEILMCLGYSEPDAGSDVASVTTRAERDGDHWIINGQKMFTTLAHESDYVFLLTRTDPTLPKHRGLTMFLAPMDSPGIEVRPVHTLGGERTNITFYSDVRVPDSARVGDVNGGWNVMTVALAFERNPTANGEAIRLLDRAVAWARAAGRLDGSDVRTRLARVAIDNEVGRLLAYRMVWVSSQERLPIVEGSMAKLFATEAFRAASSDLLDLLGAAGVLNHGDPGAPAGGWIEHAFRHAIVTTIYAGSSEIQRSIIAERGLGLPRSR